MALLTQKSIGGITTSPAVATQAESAIQFSNTYLTDSLAVSGLPRISLWTRIYGGNGAPNPTASCTAQFQIAVRTINGEPDWKTFKYILVPPINGITVTFDFPCLAIRVFFLAPVVGTLVNLDYSLSAYGA